MCGPCQGFNSPGLFKVQGVVLKMVLGLTF